MPTLSVRVDENLASRLREVARERGISISDLIREAIIYYLGSKERKEEVAEAGVEPGDLEKRIQKIEAEIRAIWRKFDEKEQEEMMEHIFGEFPVSYKEENQEGESRGGE